MFAAYVTCMQPTLHVCTFAAFFVNSIGTFLVCNIVYMYAPESDIPTLHIECRIMFMFAAYFTCKSAVQLELCCRYSWSTGFSL